MRTIIILATVTLVGIVQYCKPEPKPVVITQTKEVVKIVEVPKIVEVTRVIEKPILVKPLIKHVGPSYNFNDEMINGVKFFEGFKANPYICSGGVKTIGYGETDKNIVALGYITEHRAASLLKERLADIEEQVKKDVKVPLNDAQLCALTSFTYNLGRSRLLKLINGDNRLNSGNYESVEKILPMYRCSGGEVREGLIKRRAWELSLFKGQPTL